MEKTTIRLWPINDKRVATVLFLGIAGLSMWLKQCQVPEPMYEEGEPFHLQEEYWDNFQQTPADDIVVDEESNMLYLKEGLEILDSMNYNSLGMLIVSFEKCPDFNCAYAYARCRLGDIKTTGEMQYFIWRGGFYHTETKESL